MEESLIPTAFLLVVATIVVAAIWLVGTNRRAAAAVARDASYREIAQRSVAAQELAERRLGEIAGELTAMSARMATMERILKDAE